MIRVCRAPTDGKTTAERLKEADIERTCTEFLELDGWRSLKMEQNFSERKQKCVGEVGMADHLYIRYRQDWACLTDHPINRAGGVQVMWIEWKRLKGGVATLPAHQQRMWHWDERARGALTLIAGQDFPASIEGFREWYRGSGLARRVG